MSIYKILILVNMTSPVCSYARWKMNANVVVLYSHDLSMNICLVDLSDITFMFCGGCNNVFVCKIIQILKKTNLYRIAKLLLPWIEKIPTSRTICNDAMKHMSTLREGILHFWKINDKNACYILIIFLWYVNCKVLSL